MSVVDLPARKRQWNLGASASACSLVRSRWAKTADNSHERNSAIVVTFVFYRAWWWWRHVLLVGQRLSSSRERSSWKGSRRTDLPNLITLGGMPTLLSRLRELLGLVKLFNCGLSVKLTGREVIELRAASVTTDWRRQSSEYCSTYMSICSLRSVMGSPYFVLRDIVFFSQGPKSLLMPLYMMFPRSAASCISLQSLGK